MSTSLEKALHLAALNPPLHVFPVNNDSTKSPRTKQGFKDASSDPEIIRTMRWTSDCLVGYWAGASGVDVLDIDVKEGDGFSSLANFAFLEPEADSYDSPLAYRTISSGEHHVFRASKALAPCVSYLKIKHIDRRSGPSYAIWYGDVPTQGLWETMPPTPAWFSFGSRGGGSFRDDSVPAPENFQGDLGPWLTGLSAGEADLVLAVKCLHYGELVTAVRGLVKAAIYEPHQPGLGEAFFTILDSYKNSPETSVPEDQREKKVMDLVRYWIPRFEAEKAEEDTLLALDWVQGKAKEREYFQSGVSSQHWDPYYEEKAPKTPEELAADSDLAFKSKVHAEVERRKISQEAERLIGAEGYSGTVELSWDDLEKAHQTHMVEGFIPDDAVCFLVAKGNIGKTFTYIDMLCRMACGLPWLGKKTRQVRALIVLGEGRNGFIDRLRAWCVTHGKTIDDLKKWLFFVDGANLNNDESLARIKEVMDREEIELAVWDTWANVSGIIKEEDNGLNNVTLGRVLGIRPGISHLFVHHPRKAEEDTDAPVMRGAGSLYGRADVVITMYRDLKFLPSTGEKHSYLALSTEASHQGKNRSSGTETVRGLYLAEAEDSLVLQQITSEAIDKKSRVVREHLTGPMTVSEYAKKSGQKEPTARRWLLQAVADGVALQHKSEVATVPDQFSPVREIIPVAVTNWAAATSAHAARGK